MNRYNKIPIITLEAANDVLVKYYQNGGFVLIDNDLKEMKKVIKIIKIERTLKTRKIKRGKLIPINLEEAII
jgi:hypothetical protein